MILTGDPKLNSTFEVNEILNSYFLSFDRTDLTTFISIYLQNFERKYKLFVLFLFILIRPISYRLEIDIFVLGLGKWQYF